MSLRAGIARFKSNSDDVGFSARVGTRQMYCLSFCFGSVDNCLNIKIGSSFGSSILQVFATRARPLEVQPRSFPNSWTEGDDARKKNEKQIANFFFDRKINLKIPY